jgi:2-haloacid dehalogenase
MNARQPGQAAGAPAGTFLRLDGRAKLHVLKEARMTISTVKALAFDVFGTVVDWRGSILRELEELGTRKGIAIDWANFVDEWRAGYRPSMQRVRSGELPWTRLDDLHRMTLDGLLRRFGVGGLSPEEVEHLNRAWHRLSPWPDAVAGLTRLRRDYVLATLSNGNVALLVNMARFAGLPWDCIFSAELARHYKPDPEVYRMAVDLLGLAPHEVMLVAAHNDDLLAARAEGLRTAFVARPTEYGPHQMKDRRAEHAFDVIARDFGDLADRLGA